MAACAGPKPLDCEAHLELTKWEHRYTIPDRERINIIL
jgi:hypothetical protein